MNRPTGFCAEGFQYADLGYSGVCERVAGHPPPHAHGEHAVTLDYEHMMRMRLVEATEKQGEQLERVADALCLLCQIASDLEDR